MSSMYIDIKETQKMLRNYLNMSFITLSKGITQNT